MVQSPFSLLSPLPTPPPLFLRRKSSFLLSEEEEEEEGDAISAKSFLWEDTPPPPPPLPSYLSPKTPPVLLLLLLLPPSIFHSRESLSLPVVGAPLLQFHRRRGGGGSPPFWEIPATSGRDEEGPVTPLPPLLLTHGKRRVHDGPHHSQLTSHESAQRFLSRDGPLRAISIPFPPFLCMNGR